MYNKNPLMEAGAFKILFIHGWTASSKTDFYASLTPLLDTAGIDYVIPDLPGGKYPQAKVWLQRIHETIKNNKKPLIIVGHSLGTRAAQLYIEKYQQKVDYLFLIAAFADRLENAKRRGGDAYPDFFMHKIDMDKVKRMVTHPYILHSKDDSSIPFMQAEEIAQDLSAELIVSEDRNHFSNPTNAPYIFSVLKEKIGF